MPSPLLKARDLHDRYCREQVFSTSTPTPPLPHAGVLHLHGRRCRTQASSTPTLTLPMLPQQPITLDELRSIMRHRSSKILPFVYLQNNFSIFTSSLWDSNKKMRKCHRC
jgi:hypothetical protein